MPTKFNRYVEPFCGSACLFFEQQNIKGILSDINSDLINALNAIKTDKDLHSKLISLPSDPEYYYELRAQDTKNLSDEDRAIHFLYLNRYCFNGVYRTNRAGKFNVPRGTRTGTFPSKETFEIARKKLSNAQLGVQDYSKTLESCKEGDFVYLDPPYSKASKFTGEYGPGSFNTSNLEDIIDQLNELNRRNVKFLFSYRACDETAHSLSKSFHVKRISVKRHVSGFKTTWGEAKEILVKNYEE